MKIVQWTQINSERTFKTFFSTQCIGASFESVEHLPKCDEVTSGVLEEVLQKKGYS